MNDIRSIIEDETYLNETVEGSIDYYRKTLPELIEEFFKENKEDCLLMLDADTTIEACPTLFEEISDEYDIAVHYLNWNTWYLRTDNIEELISCTFFIRNNEKTQSLLKEWKKNGKKNI